MNAIHQKWSAYAEKCYGLLFNGEALSMESYLEVWGPNLVIPVSLNFLLVGPLSRFILGRIQKSFPN